MRSFFVGTKYYVQNTKTFYFFIMFISKNIKWLVDELLYRQHYFNKISGIYKTGK